jgi:ketopantoate reductase
LTIDDLRIDDLKTEKFSPNSQSSIKNRQFLAPAKLNIRLKVTGRRADGYHELVSIMVPVGLFDHIELELIRPGRIMLSCQGLSVPNNKENLVYRAASAFFSKAGIETEVAPDVRSIVWGKLLINVGINAITALTGIKNGELLDLEVTIALSRAAVEEAVRVAEAQNIDVRKDVVDHVLEVARATGKNRSSMGQDVDNKRLTEIKAINGVVVKEAERLGIPAPVNHTLTALVETLQAHYK